MTSGNPPLLPQLNPLVAGGGPGSRTVKKIQSEIRQRILNWSYAPGHHLGEVELSAEFNVSRVPVREALQSLVEQGLVEKILNRGCFVRQPDATAMHHLYELRLALELYNIEKLAAEGAPAAWISDEEARWTPWLLVETDNAMSPEDFLAADENFHLGIANLSFNPYTLATLKDLNERLRFVRLLAGTSAERVRSTATEHLAIVAAIARRDTPGARQALQANLDHARSKIDAAIAQASARASQASGAASFVGAGMARSAS